MDWLKGIRILLSAHYIPGPLAGTLLSNMGAEIIKIEPPFGDFMRAFPPFLESQNGKKMSAYFRTLNSGFKSVVLDFKQEKDIQKFKGLLQTADVIIDGNRANYLVQKVLGEPFRNFNNITHIPITAHGLNGPMRDIAGHDNNVLAKAGTLSYSSQTKDGLPSILGAQIADITAGYIAALSALGAIYSKKNRFSTKSIDTIDVSMLHVANYQNQIYIAGMNVTKKSPLPNKELLNGKLPNYRMYKTKDEKAIFFGPIEPNLFKNFCIKVKREDFVQLLEKDIVNLTQELTKLFASKNLSEWEFELQGVDCCFSKVNSLEEAMVDQQINELGILSTVNDPEYGKLVLANHPASFFSKGIRCNLTVGRAPELGEHNQEILNQI